MTSGDSAHGGLGTRVAVRTFVIFGLSAALPVALFAVFGYVFVSNSLAESSRAALAEASKRYGIALNERLIQVETRMLDAARLGLETASVDNGAAPDVINATPFDSRLPQGWRATRRLQVSSSEGRTDIRLVVTLGNGSREMRLVSDPTGDDFWNAEAGLPGTRACVFVGGMQLHCETPEDWPGDAELQSSEWTLFLRPRYGAESWVVRLEQPTSVAFSALRSFRSTLPIVAMIAMGIAWLLSFTHIRRINRPLMLLAAAARRMSRGRFGNPVEIVSDDEFASVGRALNHLDARLKQQFGLLTTLADMDGKILEHPSFQPVVATLLSRMPRILGCHASAVAIDAHAGAEALLLLYRAGSSETLPAVHGDDLETELRSTCPKANTWIRELITVDGKRRGVLLAGFRRHHRAGRATTTRQLRGLAHRLAVALGNEDRERALVRYAYFDPLTGLANRQLCLDRLNQALLNRRDTYDIALLNVDLDQFKAVSDSLGQAAGDALLRAVAARMAIVLSEGDTFARMGAAEFVLIRLDCGSQQAEALASRMLTILQAPFVVGDESHIVHASIGIALAPKSGSSAEELLRCASAALTRAKAAGRNRTAFFEESMNKDAERRRSVERRLRSALDSDGLTLAFQPKLRTSDGSLSGFEALTRWDDAELGKVAPAEFVPLAEETGLINELGMAALRECCRRMREWQSAGSLIPHVAVNVSVHQLRDPGFSDGVLACLADHGLAGTQIELEVTESVLATDSGVVLQQLIVLREAGIRIAMDDFGTGYSSMAALRELPIDVLKIDRSFVIRSCDSHTDEALLRGLIELAHTMGKTVVAEGVENIAQLDVLRRLGCDTVQGYLLAMPMPASDVPAFMRQSASTASSDRWSTVDAALAG